MRWTHWYLAAGLASVGWTPLQALAQTAPRPHAAASGVATAAEEAFAPTIMVGGETLRINGRGVRERLVIKVYELALYTLSGQVRNPEELYKGEQPFRLRFLSLRTNDGSLLGKLLTEGMQKNAPPEQKMLTMKYSLDMIEVFSSQQEIGKGRTFHVDYVPGQGTSFYIDGKLGGKPVVGKEFVPLILGIWLGPKPASETLKAQLLGRPVPAPPAGGFELRG